MHILALVLYGFTIWFSLIAYALIANNGWLGTVAVAGPFIISGAVGFLAALDFALSKLCRLYVSVTEKPRARL